MVVLILMSLSVCILYDMWTVFQVMSVEHYLENELCNRLPGFCMSEFSKQIM